jgi:hypothetical protein
VLLLIADGSSRPAASLVGLRSRSHRPQTMLQESVNHLPRGERQEEWQQERVDRGENGTKPLGQNLFQPRVESDRRLREN